MRWNNECPHGFKLVEQSVGDGYFVGRPMDCTLCHFEDWQTAAYRKAEPDTTTSISPC